MDEPEPRYVMTFRTGTPELIIVAILVVLGAAFAVVVSWVARTIACGEVSDCGGDGLPVVGVAVAGLVPALGMLVASGRRHGRPWQWFLLTAVVYAIWALLFSSWAS